MNPAVRRAVENVYDAFGDVPMPVAVEGCPCCMGEAELKTLVSKPRRELSPDELSKYASSVLLTVGSVGDFLYFLPRILEILALEPGWWPDAEVVARAMRTAEFSGWTESRQRAVREYFAALLDERLVTENSGSELDSWLCALGILPADIAPTLARIAANGPHLIEFYEWHSESLLKGRLSNGFWDETPAARAQVLEWFQHPGTRRAIEVQYGLA